MITASKIDTWLNNPSLLKEVPSEHIKELYKEFPYFNFAQLFENIQQQQPLETLEATFGWNPVLCAQTEARANNKYEIIEFSQTATISSNETLLVDQEAEELDSIIQQNLLIPDYFEENEVQKIETAPTETTTEDSAVLVVMSYTDWLKFLTKKSKNEKEEEASKSALRLLWQKEKLAQAIEEEADEIPEEVFEMAVNSISKSEELVSESLAEVYVRQDKKEKAIDMYKKLSLQYPEKNTYFALKIENLLKAL